MKSASKRTAITKDAYQLAFALYAGARFAQALATLKPMLQSPPLTAKDNRAAAYNLAAACALSLKQPADAESYWRCAVAERPRPCGNSIFAAAREIADQVDRVYYVELALIEHRVRKKAPRGFSFQPTSSPSSSLQLQVC